MILTLTGIMVLMCAGCGSKSRSASEDKGTVTIRVANWEEYIDEGDWDRDEAIELPGKTIFGKNSMVDDFTAWYKKTYGKKVRVEYSTFGTNEEFYNSLSLGDTYDLAAPSDYMIMKLMREGRLIPYSAEFQNTDDKNNFYSRGVSPYISDQLENLKVDGSSVAPYTAGYMWGTTGIVYNPERVSSADADSLKILTDPKYRCQVTVKDNVRDSYFAGLGLLRSKELTDLAEKYKNKEITFDEYHTSLSRIMNDNSDSAINGVEALLQNSRKNFYSFETDSGKADMVTGKVVANYQWSGDAVYTLDQAEEDKVELCYSVPRECSNIWFDGWVLMKDGIGESREKQQACEAFVNFLSRPDNAVRNMYYIGYTSCIAGPSDDSTIFDYVKYNYEADDTDEDTYTEDLSEFFSRDGSACEITAPADQKNRQFYAQYPPKDVLDRCAVMEYVDPAVQKKLNQMWINVRCFTP